MKFYVYSFLMEVARREVSAQTSNLLDIEFPLLDFPDPCEDLPSGRTPRDGNEANDNGWIAVDFCHDLTQQDSIGEWIHGEAHDGTLCHMNDDDSGHMLLPFTFDFYGTMQTAAFINNNGNLSFDSQYPTYTPSGFPNSNFQMIAPFWADVDTGGYVTNWDYHPLGMGHVWRKNIGNNVVAVAYDMVGRYHSHSDKRNSFQVLLSDGTDGSMGIGNNVCFCYEDMEWTTGNVGDPNNDGFGGSYDGIVGANKGSDGVHFKIAPPGQAVDGFDSQSDLDYLMNKSFCFSTVGNPQNIAPVAAYFPTSTVQLSQCDENPHISMHPKFLTPEGFQTVTVQVTGAPEGMTITQTPGLDGTPNVGNAGTPTWEAHVAWVPNFATQLGVHQITFVATDNYAPNPLSTTKVLEIEVVAPSSCPGDGSASGDPHIKTWAGEVYDYMGLCDLIMVQSDDFASSLGLEVQIRTEIKANWSFIKETAVRIGDQILQIESNGDYYLNGLKGVDLFSSDLSGHKIIWKKQRIRKGVYFEQFVINLGMHGTRKTRLIIEIKFNMLDVSFEHAHESDFGDSVGLMGSFPKGELVGRDGQTIFQGGEYDTFAQEWQVSDKDRVLFRDGGNVPQYPDQCKLPEAKSLEERRRLLRGDNKTKLVEDAERACASWPSNMREACIYDVLATGDLTMAIRDVFESE